MKKSLYLAGVCGIVAVAAGFGYTQNSKLTGRRVAVTANTNYTQDAVSKFPTDHRPGLFEVHRRVLWDAGWMNETVAAGMSWVPYMQDPAPLWYGEGRTTFLRPLKGYGVPEPGPGATRKVRLYVNYGHQWMCEGKPTVRIGDVDFELPMINGFFGDMGANWSEFRELSEYEHVEHAQISMYLKDFVWTWSSQYGYHCGYSPAEGALKTKGVVYRIEAVFYDEYPFE